MKLLDSRRGLGTLQVKFALQLQGPDPNYQMACCTDIMKALPLLASREMLGVENQQLQGSR
jgi:hypothetical protein